MRGLILFLTALILKSVLYPIGFTYSCLLTLFKNGYAELDNYLFKCAIADDQHANVYLAKLFNDILIQNGGHKFGNPDETISSVLGRNQIKNKLSLAGKSLNWILNLLEKDHSTKSIEHDEA
jgi:8-oxo-dGTP diphosphatase